MGPVSCSGTRGRDESIFTMPFKGYTGRGLGVSPYRGLQRWHKGALPHTYTFEVLPNVSQFFVNSGVFRLLRFALANVGDEVL